MDRIKKLKAASWTAVAVCIFISLAAVAMTFLKPELSGVIKALWIIMAVFLYIAVLLTFIRTILSQKSTKNDNIAPPNKH